MGRAGALHLVGIGGAGMSGYARVAAQLGADGQRLGPRRVAGARAAARARHRRAASATTPRTSPEGADVFVSTAIPADNPERPPRERGCRVPRAELLRELTRAASATIAVAGAHGKTTTTRMIAHVLLGCGAGARAT